MSKQHAFNGKLCHWFYCTKCGLVLLKNEASRREADKPCRGSSE